VDFGGSGEVEPCHRCQAYQQDAGLFKGVGNVEPSCVTGTGSPNFPETRRRVFRFSVVTGEERAPAVCAGSGSSILADLGRPRPASGLRFC